MKRKKGLLWSKWKVARTIWPYPEGYGVYKKHYLTGEKVIIDTGLSKEKAEEIANDLNNKIHHDTTANN